MRELLSQKEQRQLKILEYLFENPNWIYLDDLSKIIGYNARIIKSDIKELREVFPDFDIRHSTAGIMMVNVQNNGIERIYQYFLQTSDYFQILKAFFLLDRPFTYEHLSETLDISLPSLRKKVADINKTLDGTYRFKLKVTPISIIGDEKDIRFFFSQYFHETYNFLDWPFTEVKEKDIDNFVSFFISLAKFPAKYQNLYQIRTQATVDLYRMKRGYLVRLPKQSSSWLSPIYDQLSYFQRQLQDLAQGLNIEITPENLNQIFSPFAEPTFFFTVEDFLTARQSYEQVDRSYHAARDILDNLTRKFGVQFANTDTLIWNLHNTALLERREINSESIISQNKDYTLGKIKRFFPKFYEAATFEMVRYKSIMGQKEKTPALSHLIYTLFTHAEGLTDQLFEHKKKVKVLVLSEYDFAHPQFLISLYEFHTSNNIQYETWDKETLNIQEIIDSDYDAIITNFDIKGLEDMLVINISRLSILQVVNELNKISMQDL